MSKLVARMAKMKIGNLQGIQRHNQRETTNHSNKDIDISRSFLNYDLVHSQPINYQNTIREIINSQRISQRAVRKDAVLVNEWIITSDLAFFEGHPNFKKFFQDTVTYFSDRYGQQNIAYATVHLDETTPHMHLGVVPMIDGKLSSKAMFNRSALKNIQDELPQFLQDKGHQIERGLKGSEQKHLSVEEFKENKREIERMRQQIKQLHVESSSLAFETDLLNQISYQTWHNDWQDTLAEIPEFQMTYAVKNRLFETPRFEFVQVNKDTPKTYQMTFWEVFGMMQEKFRLVKEYILEKTKKIALRERSVESNEKLLLKEKKSLERKIEVLNGEIHIKNEENDNLNKMIEIKNEYINLMETQAQLSTAMPSYVKQSKLHKNMLLVPKEKWEQKHVTANTINAVWTMNERIKQFETQINNKTNAHFHVFGLEQKVAELTRQNSALTLENTLYWNGLGQLLDQRIISKKTLEQIELPQRFKSEFLLTKELDLKQTNAKTFSKKKELDGFNLGL